MKRVFLSFQNEDRRYADLIDAWAANDNDDFNLYNERLRIAVNSSQAEYIKSRLRPKIDRASVLLCIIGTGTARSEWVNWEIAYAKRCGKKLVGVLTQPSNARPREIQNAGATFIAYGRDAILRAIT
jgi:hypothetical protein